MTKHQVQWAAQFALGAELVRRGYSAAFFLGNEPGYDLLCGGKQDFRVQVKGFAWPKPKSPTAKGNFVLIGDLYTGNPSKLIVIVHVPEPPAQFEFFIATLEQLAKEAARRTTITKAGKPKKDFTAGVAYREFEQFRDCWDALPPALPN